MVMTMEMASLKLFEATTSLDQLKLASVAAVFFK